jgi:hypothetical protein
MAAPCARKSALSGCPADVAATAGDLEKEGEQIGYSGALLRTGIDRQRAPEARCERAERRGDETQGGAPALKRRRLTPVPRASSSESRSRLTAHRGTKL